MADLEVKEPPSHADVFDRMDRKSRAISGSDPVHVEIADKKDSDKVLNGAIATVAPEAQAAPAPEEKEKPVPQTLNLEDLTDQQKNELLAKWTGNKDFTLESLKPVPKELTKEEKEEKDKKDLAESIAWALSNQKIDKDFYDKSIADKSKSKRDIALQIFTDECQSEDEGLTNTECEQMFSDYYAEDEDEKSWKRKKGIKEMNAVADRYLSQYSQIENIPQEYKEVRTLAEKQKTYNKSIATIAKEIPQDLVFTIPYEGVDGKTVNLEYKVPVDSKIVDSLVREYTKPEIFFAMGESKPERLLQELSYHVNARMQAQAIPLLLKQHEDKVAEDIMVKLKNSRNPQQPIIAVAPSGTATQKTPPSHEEVMRRIKG